MGENKVGRFWTIKIDFLENPALICVDAGNPDTFGKETETGQPEIKED